MGEVWVKQAWLELMVVMWGFIMLFAFVMFEIFHEKLKERRKAGRQERREEGEREGKKEKDCAQLSLLKASQLPAGAWVGGQAVLCSARAVKFMWRQERHPRNSPKLGSPSGLHHGETTEQGGMEEHSSGGRCDIGR